MTFVQLVRPGRAGRARARSRARCRCSRARRRSGRRSRRWCCTSMAALARRLGVPFRSGGSLCASKVADAQAAYESAATLQPTVLGGVNFVLHAAGWLEGGLAVGYEKFILDADQCGMMAVFVKGVDMSENGQALDAIRSERAGPALPGHGPHAGQLRDRVLPLARSPTTTASSSGRGRRRSTRPQRANAIWKRMLREYEAPPIDPGDRRGAARVHHPAQGVDAGLGGLAAVLFRRRSSLSTGTVRGARPGPARARRSSSCRSRTRSTRRRSCRPARPCR